MKVEVSIMFPCSKQVHIKRHHCPPYISVGVPGSCVSFPPRIELPNLKRQQSGVGIKAVTINAPTDDVPTLHSDHVPDLGYLAFQVIRRSERSQTFSKVSSGDLSPGNLLRSAPPPSPSPRPLTEEMYWASICRRCSY